MKTAKAGAAVLRVLAIAWLVLGALAIAAGTAMVWWQRGFGAVQDLLSPFNFWNYLAMAVLLLPGVIAYNVSEKLRHR